MCIFNAVKKQSGIGFIVDAFFFCNFAYLHSLYTVVQLHTNFVLMYFERQPMHQVGLLSTFVCGSCIAGKSQQFFF